MANTGLVIAGSGANDASAGDVAWTTPGNVTASDNSRAQAINIDSGQTSQYLKATGFDFSAIPAGSTIDGIQVRVERSEKYGNNNSVDHTIQLLKAGSRVGTNKADTVTNWPTTDTNADYGGSTDLWGTTWTLAQIQASNFGVSIRFGPPTSKNHEAYVDAVWIKVWYTVPTGASMQAIFIG